MENFKSETIGELTKAVIEVMTEVKGMEKNSRIGTGNSAYDGTKDKDVKEVFNEKFAEKGLAIMPIDVQEETQTDRWEEEDAWSKTIPKAMKTKQSVFTKVKTKYLLSHISGEWVVLAGYGQGVDPQDKGAGKATTYALKNCLLYTFLTPVGKIDDTDLTHSNDIKVPVKQPTKPVKEPAQLAPAKQVVVEKPILLKDSEEWKKLIGFMESGALTRIGQVTKKFEVSDVLVEELSVLIEDAVNSRIVEEHIQNESPEKPIETPKNVTRLPAIPADVFAKALKGTKIEVLRILGEYRMSADQRAQLTEKTK